ncbi:MAG: tripartite tricarboxylate transporter substrate binding protein [Pseudomonadota bacterium]
MNDQISMSARSFAKHLCVAAIVCAGMNATLAHAQDWPAKSIKIVVPFAAGGNTDSIARLTAERLTKALGKTVIVENRAGGNGVIAAELVSNAAPDGYTLLMAPMPVLALLPSITKVPYDGIKDFVPISNIGSNPFVLGVSKSVPVNTVTELIKHVHANPGKLNYASGGSGSVSHLSAALFAQRAKMEMTHVSYKGGAPAMADLMAGHVQMYFGNLSELAPHQKSGTIRIVAVSSEKRNRGLPDVPTIAESGYPGFRTVTWNGLVAPKGTPPEIITRLAFETQKIAATASFIAQLAIMGVDTIGSTPQEFAATIKQDATLWAGAAKAANLTID